MATPPKSDSKKAWKGRNDAGPHTATFPSGATLTFTIPDSGSLVRSGRLPQNLRRIALLCAGHPDGADGYMRDLVMQAIVTEADRGDVIEKTIADGLDLANVLVSEMLVEPNVTPEEVAAGEFPEMDIRMLLEFAERRRNTDAAGNKLPIIVLGEWARFPGEPAGAAGPGDGGEGGDPDGADGADPDGDQV